MNFQVEHDLDMVMRAMDVMKDKKRMEAIKKLVASRKQKLDEIS